MLNRDNCQRKIRFKISEKNLSDSEEILNFFLSNVNDLIVIISNEKKILYMNTKAEEEFGYNQIGNFCFEVLMNKNSVCKFCCFDKLNLNSVGKFNNQNINPKKAFEKKFECSKAFIIDYNEQLAIIDIVREVKVKEKNEDSFKDSEELFRNLVESLQSSIFLLDINKKIYDCNTNAELYLNKPKEELVGNNFFDFFPKSKEVIDSCDELVYNVIKFNLNEIVEFNFINDKGTSSVVEVIFSPLKYLSMKFAQVVMTDITERVLVDNIIREENERLRKIDNMKQQLTTQTSDAIKTPLVNMYNASQTLLDSYNDKLDQNAIKLLEMIKNGGKKSINLVKRIIDISKIKTEEIKLDKQIESLTEIICISVDETMSQIKQQDFTLNLNLTNKELYSEIDRNKIKQAIKNILSYIFNYAPKKSTISITLQENNEIVEISINIEGIVLRNKETHLTSSNKYDPNNSFLGFHLSKELFELHGGQINVESNEGGEISRFILKLPIIDWTKSLLHIYILYISGVLLHHYQFVEDIIKSDSVLISSSLIGMMSILKEVVQAEKSIKIIDHGDRKIIFEMDKTNQVVFALIVKENLLVLHQKLLNLITEFDIHYQSLIENIDETCSVSDNWSNLDCLIKKHFR